MAYTDGSLPPLSRGLSEEAQALPRKKGYTAVQSFSPDDELPEGLEDALGHAEDAERFLEAWRKAAEPKLES